MSDGVHESHCCRKCGCKYGHADCMVATGRSAALYACQDCEEARQDLIETLAHMDKAELDEVILAAMVARDTAPPQDQP